MPTAYSLQLNSGLSDRAFQTLALVAFKLVNEKIKFIMLLIFYILHSIEKKKKLYRIKLYIIFIYYILLKKTTLQNFFRKMSQCQNTYYSLSVPNLTAISWYSCRVRATKSGQPRVFNWLAATREARVSPGNVTTGVPVHKTSILVVCPLQSGVSRHTSANWPRLTCSSLAATLLNRILPGVKPNCCAVAWRLGSPTAGKRSNHSTEFGTCFKI